MNKKVTVSMIRPIDPKEGFKNNHFEYLETYIKPIVENCSDNDTTFDFTGLVSESSGVSIITNRIVKQTISADFVIGIMSGLNANVMFELGIRMSQRKPTIIIMDDETEFPFDVEHFEIIKYPHDLNGPDLNEFREKFSSKFKGTWQSFEQNNGADTFIASFDDSSLVDPTINTMSLNEAADKLGALIQHMEKNFIVLKTDDNFDTENFNNDVQIDGASAEVIDQIIREKDHH